MIICPAWDSRVAAKAGEPQQRIGQRRRQKAEGHRTIGSLETFKSFSMFEKELPKQKVCPNKFFFSKKLHKSF
jgi:hypothetical protein